MNIRESSFPFSNIGKNDYVMIIIIFFTENLNLKFSFAIPEKTRFSNVFLSNQNFNYSARMKGKI